MDTTESVIKAVDIRGITATDIRGITATKAVRDTTDVITITVVIYINATEVIMEIIAVRQQGH
jgi:hypothetical protein